MSSLFRFRGQNEKSAPLIVAFPYAFKEQSAKWYLAKLPQPLMGAAHKRPAVGMP